MTTKNALNINVSMTGDNKRTANKKVLIFLPDFQVHTFFILRDRLYRRQIL